MNDYEQKIKQIIDTIPSWEKDGGGIRGRAIAPLIGGASGPNLMGDPIPQQFSQQRSELIQQQDDPLPTLSLPASGNLIGENVGDLLYWDGSAWVILPPPSDSALRVLATNGGVPFWLGTEECD